MARHDVAGQAGTLGCSTADAGRELTPNEMYASWSRPWDTSRSRWPQRLHRAAAGGLAEGHADGVKIGNRTYDCKALTPSAPALRGERQDGLWGVHFDPHDVTRAGPDHLGDGDWILCRGRT